MLIGETPIVRLRRICVIAARAGEVRRPIRQQTLAAGSETGVIIPTSVVDVRA